MAPPKCQKLPSSIPKTAQVKFWATSSSLSTTLSCIGVSTLVTAYKNPQVCIVVLFSFFLFKTNEKLHSTGHEKRGVKLCFNARKILIAVSLLDLSLLINVVSR